MQFEFQNHIFNYNHSGIVIVNKVRSVKEERHNDRNDLKFCVNSTETKELYLAKEKKKCTRIVFVFLSIFLLMPNFCPVHQKCRSFFFFFLRVDIQEIDRNFYNCVKIYFICRVANYSFNITI